MKKGALCALILGTGYLLGRRKRLGAALVLGGAAAAGRLSANSGGLLRSLGGSVDVARLLDLRGPLVAAGKAAAVSAVSSRIDSVSDRLHGRADTLRGVVRDTADDDRDDGPYLEDEPDDAEADRDDESDRDDRPSARRGRDLRSPRRNAGGRSGRSAGRDTEEDPDDGDAEEDDVPRQRPAPRSRQETTKAPVRRRGR
ncbi:hypothetical protein AB0I61_20565 [Polymorphospora rubra]|uniref:hypothetical protein n=1 Tax=Polymorphospora rubra TaxID=338584 RepID=UPI0033EB6B39